MQPESLKSKDECFHWKDPSFHPWAIPLLSGLYTICGLLPSFLLNHSSSIIILWNADSIWSSSLWMLDFETILTIQNCLGLNLCFSYDTFEFESDFKLLFGLIKVNALRLIAIIIGLIQFMSRMRRLKKRIQESNKWFQRNLYWGWRCSFALTVYEILLTVVSTFCFDGFCFFCFSI